MSTFDILKAKREKRQELRGAQGKAAQIFAVAHKENRSINPEEREQITKIDADDELLQAEIRMLENQLEAERQLSASSDTRSAGREDFKGKTGDGGADPNSGAGADTPENRAREKRVFRKWVLQPVTQDSLTARPEDMITTEDRSWYQKRLQEIRMTKEEQAGIMEGLSDKERRALSAVSGAGGAYTMPVGFENSLEIALKFYGSILQAATIWGTDNGNLIPYPTVNDTTNTGAQVGENTTVDSSGADPSFGLVNFGAYMFTSKTVLLPVQLIQDSAFDLESKLAELLGIRLGRILNTKATTGSGASTLKGIITASTKGADAASHTAVSYADLINLEHSIDRAYRLQPGAGFMFHDTILKAIKLLVDGSGRPLFIAGGVSQGIQAKAPDTIDGFPFVINNDMDSTLSSGYKTMAFGLLSKYIVRQVRGVQLVRFMERYMDSLQIGFMAFQRYDGNLVDAGTNPVKYLLQ